MKCEDLDKVIIGDDLERFFQVEARLPLQEKEELVELLRRNIAVFAWNAYEAPGLNPEFIMSSLKCRSLSHSKKATTFAPFK